jgi:hypothetical protein
MPIFRRTNFIITASGTVTLCTVQQFTENDDTRCCDNIICPPEDGHGAGNAAAEFNTYGSRKDRTI